MMMIIEDDYGDHRYHFMVITITMKRWIPSQSIGAVQSAKQNSKFWGSARTTWWRQGLQGDDDDDDNDGHDDNDDGHDDHDKNQLVEV